MPYIKKQDRYPYFSVIDGVLRGIPPSNNPLEQAEYLGYFLSGVVENFYKKGRYAAVGNLFAVYCKDDEAKATLDEQIKNTYDTLGCKDIMSRGGELNYVMSAVIWGFLGDSTHFETAKYAVRSYMRGILLRIKDHAERYQPYGEEECRFYIMLRGVLGDVMDELYRRKTSRYENAKISENGDVWPLRIEAVKVT